MNYREELLERVEMEILSTPTGHVRNLLTDVQILLSIERNVKELTKALREEVKDSIIEGNYELKSDVSVYSIIDVDGLEFKLWHGNTDKISIFDKDIISEDIDFTEEESLKAYTNFSKKKDIDFKAKIHALENQKKDIEKKIDYFKRATK